MTKWRLLAAIAAIVALSIYVGISWGAEPTAGQVPVRIIELKKSPSVEKIPVISGVAVDRTGKMLATVGDDHILRIWNLDDGTVLYRLTAPHRLDQGRSLPPGRQGRGHGRQRSEHPHLGSYLRRTAGRIARTTPGHPRLGLQSGWEALGLGRIRRQGPVVYQRRPAAQGIGRAGQRSDGLGIFAGRRRNWPRPGGRARSACGIRQPARRRRKFRPRPGEFPPWPIRPAAANWPRPATIA